MRLTVLLTSHGRDADGLEHLQMQVESGEVLDAHALELVGGGATDQQVKTVFVVIVL